MSFSLQQGLTCLGSQQEDRKCKDYIVQVCCATRSQWSEWSDWTTCSKKCGGGQNSRERRCLNNVPETTCEGADEPNSKSQTQKCNKHPCVRLHDEMYRNEVNLSSILCHLSNKIENFIGNYRYSPCFLLLLFRRLRNGQ